MVVMMVFTNFHCFFSSFDCSLAVMFYEHHKPNLYLPD